MLERLTHPNSAVTYQSPFLRAAGIVHGFSTRIGGVSQNPFSSLNLGNPSAKEFPATQDPRENIAENFRRFQQAIGCPDNTPRAWVTQVHGRRVELIEREPENEYAESLAAEIRDRFNGQLAADALVSTVPGILATVRVADCVPILLASEDGQVVAAVHAGWRGVVGNVVEKAAHAMCEAAPTILLQNLIAAIGPAISAPHFEVGPEVATEFVNRGLASAVQPPSACGKPHINLQAAVTSQLQSLGITRIDSADLCTFRDAQEFFSHRRSQGLTGRLAAGIAAH